MNNLFRNCISLISLPDLSKWDTSNVKGKYNTFEECINILCIPKSIFSGKSHEYFSYKEKGTFIFKKKFILLYKLK